MARCAMHKKTWHIMPHIKWDEMRQREIHKAFLTKAYNHLQQPIKALEVPLEFCWAALALTVSLQLFRCWIEWIKYQLKGRSRGTEGCSYLFTHTPIYWTARGLVHCIGSAHSTVKVEPLHSLNNMGVGPFPMNEWDGTQVCCSSWRSNTAGNVSDIQEETNVSRKKDMTA